MENTVSLSARLSCLPHSFRSPFCVRGSSSSMIIMFGKYVFVVTPEASQPPPSAKLPQAPPSSPLSSLWGWLLCDELIRGRFFATLFYLCLSRSTNPCIFLPFSLRATKERVTAKERDDENVSESVAKRWTQPVARSHP